MAEKPGLLKQQRREPRRSAALCGPLQTETMPKTNKIRIGFDELLAIGIETGNTLGVAGTVCDDNVTLWCHKLDVLADVLRSKVAHEK